MFINCSSHPNFDAHHEVHRFEDEISGLVVLVAIHRLGTLGLAGGGCRMWPYSDEDAALRDVLRLSQDMTYKLSLAGLGAGGAKCVVIGDPKVDKTEDFLERLGESIHSLEGRFVVGGDVGTNADDLKVIARRTPYVELGSYGRDTVSEATAGGVYWAMHGALRYLEPGASFEGKRIAIQGTGKVGSRLAEMLSEDGASLIVSDVDEQRAQDLARRVGAQVVPAWGVTKCDVDIFAPCALGDVLTEESVSELNCRIVAGSANNQLISPDVAHRLRERSIVYVPDFIANMGGALAGAKPHACHSPASVKMMTQEVENIVARVLEMAEEHGLSTHDSAVSLAKARDLERLDTHRAVIPWFHRLWRLPLFARTALRLRTWFEELRGRWASATA